MCYKFGVIVQSYEEFWISLHVLLLTTLLISKLKVKYYFQLLNLHQNKNKLKLNTNFIYNYINKAQ